MFSYIYSFVKGFAFFFLISCVLTLCFGCVMVPSARSVVHVHGDCNYAQKEDDEKEKQKAFPENRFDDAQAESCTPADAGRVPNLNIPFAR